MARKPTLPLNQKKESNMVMYAKSGPLKKFAELKRGEVFDYNKKRYIIKKCRYQCQARILGTDKFEIFAGNVSVQPMVKK